MAGTPRFLTLPEVAEVLNTSVAQVYALVRRRDLVGVKLGGRGQWRVESTRLEEYIAQLYVDTEKYLAEHPFTDTDDSADSHAGTDAGTDADPLPQTVEES